MKKLLVSTFFCMVYAAPESSGSARSTSPKTPPKYKTFSSCMTPALMVCSPVMPYADRDLFSLAGYDISLNQIAYLALIISMTSIIFSQQGVSWKKSMIQQGIAGTLFAAMLLFQAYLPILYTYVTLIFVAANTILQFINTKRKFGLDTSLSGLAVLLVSLMHFALLATFVGCEYFEADLPSYFELAALIVVVLIVLVSAGCAIQRVHTAYKGAAGLTGGHRLGRGSENPGASGEQAYAAAPSMGGPTGRSRSRRSYTEQPTPEPPVIPPDPHLPSSPGRNGLKTQLAGPVTLASPKPADTYTCTFSCDSSSCKGASFERVQEIVIGQFNEALQRLGSKAPCINLGDLLDTEDFRKKLKKTEKNYCSVCVVEKKSNSSFTITNSATLTGYQPITITASETKDLVFVDLRGGSWEAVLKGLAVNQRVVMVSLSEEVHNNRTVTYKKCFT